MHKYLIANWKMELSEFETENLTNQILVKHTQSPAQIILCPSFLFISNTVASLWNTSIHTGAQDVHTAPRGKFTGEISARMLKDVGCTHAIVGHSERRHYFGESDELIARKARALDDVGIIPIICIGESQEERKKDKHLSSLRAQILNALAHLDDSHVIIAYEPIWAIGSGKTASVQQITEVHTYLRKILIEERKNGDKIPLLYGGSLNAKNCQDIFSCTDVNGGLVGGSALDSNEFMHMFEKLGSSK